MDKSVKDISDLIYSNIALAKEGELPKDATFNWENILNELVEEKVKNAVEATKKACAKSQIPTFDYWMLSEINTALELQYQKTLKDGNYGVTFKHISEKLGLAKAKEAQKQVDENRFHPLGKIALTMARIQQIKDVYNKEVTHG